MTDIDQANMEQAFSLLDNPEIGWKFIDLFVAATDWLNDGLVDYVVLPARRMTSLYVLLQSNGLQSPAKGKFISDRYLEQSSKFHLLSGKKIALVDDIYLSLIHI